jgi:hypothetical protein
MKKILFSATLIILAVFSIARSAGPQDMRAPGEKMKLGVAVTPRNFPKHTMDDIDAAFRMTGELGDYAVFITQWNDNSVQTAELMVNKCREHGLKVILGLSPTTLGEARSNLDFPASLHRKVGRKKSFGNNVIRKAFRQTAKDLARLKPDYLCLATEINMLAFKKIDEYLKFAGLYKKAYRDVKKISPDTKVFVSFQWDWTRILDEKEPAEEKIREHTKLIDIFRPELDVICFTTYPCPFYRSAEKLPDDYYSWMHRHIEGNDEVVFMEVGWPAVDYWGELEQVAYIRRLPELMKDVNISIIAWALLHDVNLDEFSEHLNTVGLVKRNGEKKPGYEAFMELGEIWR